MLLSQISNSHFLCVTLLLESMCSEALRATFHRIDDMLEDKKYANLLNRLKALSNPSDVQDADSDDDEDAGMGGRGGDVSFKPNYTKFNPKDPQWESDSEEDSSSNRSGVSRSADDGSGSKPKQKKVITRKEAIELFTQLLMDERNKKMSAVTGGGGPSEEASAGKADIFGDSDDDIHSESFEYMNEWKKYYYNKDRIPGDRPRPSQQVEPASVRHASDAHQCNLREHAVQAGCTAVVVLRVGDLLYCANAGDSRAVLCRGDGKVHALSEDHKPTSITELGRIEKAGGFVNANGRVNGNLNLSRSLGDMKYKQVPNLLPKDQMITAEPDITVTEVKPTDRFFVLACDGVWDVLSNQEICDFISTRLDQGMSTKDIVREVFSHCVADDPRKTQGIGGDNMTCMIVLLNQ